ncbi:MAG TPA: cyclase family protein [Gaiellaceae bacterium]|nr:cyclase family protein [Gaiellaceae bacterium]
MEIFDIRVPIRTGMVTYPGDPQVRLERVASIADGAPANVSKLDFGVHSGTHVDATVHFIEGAAGAEQLSLDVLLGPCVVVATEGLSRSDVARAPEGAERVLFKTSNSELWAQNEFPEDFARFDAEAAQLLVDRGVKLVGVDWLSVGHEDVHHILLDAGVVPIEGLDLRGVEPGDYFLVAAPLKIEGSDGAPARVLLIRGLPADY